MNEPTNDRLNRIRFLLTDVDGVLTDGRLYFDHEGNESKVFHVFDGAALAYWHRAGFASGFLSGRECAPVHHRAASLHVEEIHLGHLDKLPVLEEIAKRRGLDMAEIAYMGDDLLDLPVLAQVGFAASVANGRPEVRERVHYVSETPGGQGALREIVELILKAKNLWDGVVASDGRG
jgi:3-deoxy-D-manno-octulosonate 8-phosphate phosphatase (KDO 8-P phosphatase)